MRLDDELDAGGTQLVGSGFPLGHGEHHAEVAHGHVVAVDGAGLAVADFIRSEMGDDLVAVEVEIHPFRRTAAFRAAEDTAVERTRRGNIVHRKSKVKWGNHRRDVAHVGGAGWGGLKSGSTGTQRGGR